MTVSAGDGNLAHRLAVAWTEAFDRQGRAELQRQFDVQNEQASRTNASFMSQRTKSQTVLDDCNLADASSMRKAELVDLEASLATSRSQLHTLTQINIPNDEARLASLRRAVDPMLDGDADSCLGSDADWGALRDSRYGG